MFSVGCDFSSAPTPRKPVVLATGVFSNEIGSMSASVGVFKLSKIERFESLDAWSHWLQSEREPWIGGFDLPFGLPRELVQTLNWPTDWLACMRHYAALSRDEVRAQFKAFCDARPVGGKFAHRATDLPAGSSPSMKWVNPPVAFMLHAGVPRLIEAGCDFPGLHRGRHDRVALEAYPGMLAREVLGHRSYKSDDSAKHTPERLIARKDLIEALEAGTYLKRDAAGRMRRTALKSKLRLRITHAQRDTLVADASADTLDAVLCALQAAWGLSQGAPRFGLPKTTDPLEGWIVGVDASR